MAKKKSAYKKKKEEQKKERIFSAAQAASVCGVHPRYKKHLTKRHGGEYKTIEGWRESFIIDGLLIEA